MFRGEFDQSGYPKPPETVLVTTGEEELTWKAQEEFFEAIIKFLGYSQEHAGIFYSVRDKYLIPIEWMSGDDRNSDDSIRELVIAERRVVAYMLRIYNENACIQVIYGHCLDQNLEKIVRRKPQED